MYSDMIEHAAGALSVRNGWTYSRALEYVEDLVFNSEADISGLMSSIAEGTYEIHPPLRIRRRRHKGQRRDLWKSPYAVQEARVLGL